MIYRYRKLSPHLDYSWDQEPDHVISSTSTQILQEHAEAYSAKTVAWFQEQGAGYLLFCEQDKDMVDTAGTLTKASDLMIQRGALSVRAVCTHGILSGDAYKKIEKSSLAELIITDTIPVESRSRKVKILSCAQLFASTMKNVHLNKSIDKNFLN